MPSGRGWGQSRGGSKHFQAVSPAAADRVFPLKLNSITGGLPRRGSSLKSPFVDKDDRAAQSAGYSSSLASGAVSKREQPLPCVPGPPHRSLDAPAKDPPDTTWMENYAESLLEKTRHRRADQ